MGRDIFSSWQEVWEETSSAIRGVGFEDAEDGVEQFAGDRHEGLELGFVASLKGLVEGLEVRVEANGDEGRHIESASEMAVAVAADAGEQMHPAARDAERSIEPAMGPPLAHRHLLICPPQPRQPMHR